MGVFVCVYVCVAFMPIVLHVLLEHTNALTHIRIYFEYARLEWLPQHLQQLLLKLLLLQWMLMPAVTMGWNVRFVCFADIDNDVGGGGDAVYVHTCQYTYMCIYDGIQCVYIYIYILYLMVRTNAKKNIILQQTLFGLDAYRLNANNVE